MANPFSYEGRRVVVTGASSGVGAALVDLLVELGAESITTLDVKEPGRETPASVTFVHTDLADPTSIDGALQAIAGPVHALFNNAGVAATLPARVVLSVNYLGARHLTDGLLDKMPSGAAVANTASIAGGGWPQHVTDILELLAIDGWDESLAWIDAHADLVADPYAFSKECMQVHTMRSSKATIARGVRTNSVCPGIIETPLIPDFEATMSRPLLEWTANQGLGRFATSAEIAAVLAFLGSDASAYMNGTNLIADSGFSAAMATNQIDFASLPS
ncbi:MAG TPA: coniferyl-alcohol dehydrogenase [Acidimicrobiales bacterium]|nr:coniferyl-alcohol dehydrogenase [Acidimicrobiales bacterium]